MNQLTMSDIQFNFSNVTIALQIGNDGKAQLTFTPTQTTELYANTVQPAPHADGHAVNTPDRSVANTPAPVVNSQPAQPVVLTPPPAAAPAAPAAPQVPAIPAQQVVYAPAAPAAPAEAAASFLSGNTAIPAQPSAEAVAQLVQQSQQIVQGH